MALFAGKFGPGPRLGGPPAWVFLLVGPLFMFWELLKALPRFGKAFMQGYRGAYHKHDEAKKQAWLKRKAEREQDRSHADP